MTDIPEDVDRTGTRHIWGQAPQHDHNIIACTRAIVPTFGEVNHHLVPQALKRFLQRFREVKITPFLPLLVRRSDLDRESESQQAGDLCALLGPEEAVLILYSDDLAECARLLIEMRPFLCLKFEYTHPMKGAYPTFVPFVNRRMRSQSTMRRSASSKPPRSRNMEWRWQKAFRSM